MFQPKIVNKRYCFEFDANGRIFPDLFIRGIHLRHKKRNEEYIILKGSYPLMDFPKKRYKLAFPGSDREKISKYIEVLTIPEELRIIVPTRYCLDPEPWDLEEIEAHLEGNFINPLKSLLANIFSGTRNTLFKYSLVENPPVENTKNIIIPVITNIYGNCDVEYLFYDDIDEIDDYDRDIFPEFVIDEGDNFVWYGDRDYYRILGYTESDYHWDDNKIEKTETDYLIIHLEDIFKDSFLTKLLEEIITVLKNFYYSSAEDYNLNPVIENLESFLKMHIDSDCNSCILCSCINDLYMDKRILKDEVSKYIHELLQKNEVLAQSDLENYVRNEIIENLRKEKTYTNNSIISWIVVGLQLNGYKWIAEIASCEVTQYFNSVGGDYIYLTSILKVEDETEYTSGNFKVKEQKILNQQNLITIDRTYTSSINPMADPLINHIFEIDNNYWDTKQVVVFFGNHYLYSYNDDHGGSSYF